MRRPAPLPTAGPGRPEELKLEAEELEETRLAAAPEPIHPKTMRIGGHEVVEELREGEDVSYLRCLKCGLTVRLDEVASLTDTPCTEERRQEAGAEQGMKDTEAGAQRNRQRYHTP